MLRQVHILTLMLKIMIKILSLKLVTMCNRNIRIFLLKLALKIGLKKVFLLKKVKMLYHGHKLLVIATVKKLKHFTKKNCKKDKSNRV